MEPRSLVVEPAVANAPGAPSPRLHALHWGREEALPLVLLHGGGGNAHWWDHLAPGLARNFRVVARDFRGHGDSASPTGFAAGDLEHDLDALLDRLGTRAVVLVGHSMGAAVALAHAAREPRTLGLVLLDPARGGSRRAGRRTRLALSLRRSHATQEAAIANLRFLPDAEHCPEALRLAIARHSVRRQEDGRFGYKFDPRCFAVAPAERPDPSRVACPTLIVRGAESPILGPEAAEALRTEIQLAELIEIPQAGHHVQLDAPEATLAALETFLAAHFPSLHALQSGGSRS